MKTNIPVFSKLCYLQNRNFINLPLNSLTPNLLIVSFSVWSRSSQGRVNRAESLYIYIYIYVCVCVCVLLEKKTTNKLQLHGSSCSLFVFFFSNDIYFALLICTELSKHIWALKGSSIKHFISWRILLSSSPYNSASKRCNLCPLKKNFLSSADLNRQPLTMVMNLYLHAATGTKHCFVIANHFNCNSPPPLLCRF